MSIRTPRIVSSKCMEDLFRHGNVAWVVGCLIATQKPPQDHQHYHVDIQSLLGKHKKVFEPLSSRRPLDRIFEHIIELEEGENLVITTPYKHPKRFKD